MNLKQITLMFNRALASCFGIKKFFCLFLSLLFAGIILLFFQGIALYVPTWLQLPLKGIPLFILIGFLMAGGSLITKFYLEEKKTEIVLSSWELILRASYVALPLLLAFLVFWILLGVFVSLKAIPYIGVFFGIILSFAPFLLNLATLLLFLAALGMFFYLTPWVTVEKYVDRQAFFNRFKKDVFTHLLLLGVAFLPVWIVWLFVAKAVWLTYELYSIGDVAVEKVLQAFFMMLPFLAILTPALIFFFNFAVEAFNYFQTDNKPRKESGEGL